MLFNPEWKTKTDPHSLKDFIAWLETKNPKEWYNYAVKRDCLLTQWVRHCDADAMGSGSSLGYIVHGQRMNFYNSPFHRIANGIGAGGGDYTFGGALKRAQDALAEQENV